MSDAETLVNFLVQLCDTNTMKTVTAESLMMKILDVERIFVKETRSSSTTSASFHSTTHSSIDRMDSSSSLSSGLSTDSVDDIVNRTFLDFLMDFVTQFEFPQKIVTFLLHLLPSAAYKVHVLNNYWMRLSKISWIIKTKVCVICQSRRLRHITQARGFDNSWYHAKTEFNNCFIIHFSHNSSSETEAKRSAILLLRRTLQGA